MCARRFLMVIFVLTLLVVAGAFALFQWGGNVLVREGTPKGHFQAAQAGGGPDYTQLNSWLCHPTVFSTRANGKDSMREINDDPCRWQPPQAVSDLRGWAETFYIHPTTYLERDRWNAPLHPGGDTELRTRLFAETQASAFNGVGRVWAPRYRQAAYGAFLLRNSDAEKALDLAYSDVAAAFDEFVKEIPKDSPIILAGHSQGALHLERLLREKIAGKPIAKRVIAAYVVGWPISTTADLPALGLPACQSSDQVGCILSWMTFGEPANPSLILDPWEKTKGFDGGVRRQDDILCVNPITGTQNGAAQKGVGGIIVPSSDMRSPTVSYNAVLAHCANGLLITDTGLPPLGPYVLPGNNYHVYDYALFYGAISGDASHRYIEWVSNRK
jgi:hypothetical protein